VRQAFRRVRRLDIPVIPAAIGSSGRMDGLGSRL
jgi:hypothetical protein